MFGYPFSRYPSLSWTQMQVPCFPPAISIIAPTPKVGSLSTITVLLIFTYTVPLFHANTYSLCSSSTGWFIFWIVAIDQSSRIYDNACRHIHLGESKAFSQILQRGSDMIHFGFVYNNGETVMCISISPYVNRRILVIIFIQIKL